MLRVHSEPLIRAIEARGGLAAVVNQYDYPERERRRLARSYQRALSDGDLTYKAADELCVRLLGTHPLVVFGDAWLGDLLEQPT